MHSIIIKKKSKRWKIILITLAIIFSAGGWWIWHEGRPWYYGIQAYMYGFPLVVMDLTREVGTAVPAPGELNAPVNQFGVMTSYPDVTYRVIPRTGLDAQFAVAWADLDEEPLILSVPNTNGRYYVIALFDMWSNVFASIGSRTTGTDSANFLIAGPTWKGHPPEGMAQVYHSPTRYVWVNCQMQSKGPDDYEEVNKLQKQYKLTPLSSWGQSYSPPAEVEVKEDVDKSQTIERIKKMDAQEFYGRMAKLMKDNPPFAEDAPILEKLKFLGIEPGKDFTLNEISPNKARGLRKGMKALALMAKGIQKLETKDGWLIIPENFANYGTDYLTRAGIALIGLGGIWPKDIMYPTAFNDSQDEPLDGLRRYILHFEKDQFPPANVTWSVSSYDPEGWYVPNVLDRYHLAAWMPLKFNEDGSLDIYIQADSPGPDKESNWLPVPASGPFNLVTRIFWPKEAALNGSWTMPGIIPMEKFGL